MIKFILTLLSMYLNKFNGYNESSSGLICQNIEGIVSISEQVAKTVSHMKKGEPFPIDRLYKLGSATAIQKALSRMVKEGKLTRVAKGIYVRPKPLKLAPNKMSKTSPKKIAEAWSRFEIVCIFLYTRTGRCSAKSVN